MLMFGGGALDRQVYEALYAGQRPGLVAVARFFTAIGDPTVLIIAGLLSALWVWVAGHRHWPRSFSPGVD
jgi:hypothetical protein